jgi:hypothetical protein
MATNQTTKPAKPPKRPGPPLTNPEGAPVSNAAGTPVMQ